MVNKSIDRPRAHRGQYERFHSIQTRWMDNDVYGHVNNVIYYSFFDTAVNALLIGEGLLAPSESQAIGLVVETGCRYFESVAFPEEVQVGVAVEQIGRSSVRYGIGIFKPGNHVAVAEGFFVHVYVDRTSRTKADIPEQTRRFLETLRT